MTYKGIIIEGEPTVEMIRDYIESKHLKISAYKVFKHYIEVNWKTQKGNEISTLESAINGCNSKYQKYCKDEKEYIDDYISLLNTEKWKTFSNVVKAYYGYRCFDCGSSANLQSHHIVYHERRLPWEYELNEMVCLCKTCHKKRHNVHYNNVLKELPEYIEIGRASLREKITLNK